MRLKEKVMVKNDRKRATNDKKISNKNTIKEHRQETDKKKEGERERS